MKNNPQSRPTPDMEQYAFDANWFTPNGFEDSAVALLKATLDLGTEFNIVSSIDFTPNTDTAKPLIVCEVGQIDADLSKNALNLASFGLDAFPGSVDNSLAYASYLWSTLAVRCLARSAREARKHSYTILQYLYQLSHFMPEMFDINEFAVTTLTPPKKVEGDNNDHLWFSQVVCKFALEYSWSIERVAPRLKTLGLIGLNAEA